MSVNMQNRRKATAPLSFPVDDEVLNLRYRVTHMTPADLAELNRAGDAAMEAIKAAEKMDAEPKVETAASLSVSELAAANPDADAPITPEAAEPAPDGVQAMFDKIDELHSILMDNLIEVVDWWDLMDGEDVVPLTREGLIKHDVDFDLISYILGKVKEAKTPEKK